jgi:DNA repair exonuclease SbcCD ATPase subunit
MKDKYDTVFVITHIDYFKEQISKKLLVTKENAKSRIEVLHE